MSTPHGKIPSSNPEPRPVSVFLRGGIGFLVVACLLHFVTYLAEQFDPMAQTWQKERIRESLSYLGALHETRPVILLVGTSELQSGLDPMRIDSLLSHRGLTTLTLNMSVDNLGLWMPMYLARLASEIRRSGVRPKLIAVHVPLSSITKRAQNRFSVRMKSEDIASILLNRDLLFSSGLSTSDVVLTAFNKWILGERSVQKMARMAHMILPGRGGDFSEIDFSARFDLWYSRESHPEPAWDPTRQGQFYFNIEKEPDWVRDKIQTMQEGDVYLKVLNQYRKCCDYERLEISPEYLSWMEPRLAELASLTEQLVLLVLPEHPEYRRGYRSAGNLERALKEMKPSGQSEVWHFDLGQTAEPTDFLDISHLSPSGVIKLTDEFVDKVDRLFSKTENK
ncbi:MAG: hypothetical protein AB7F86_13630 [Bdellovibrionales bacterium]